MRVLVCPTAYKGSLTADAVAEAMERGVARVRPDAEVERLPLSDGGPGLLDALSAIGRTRSVAAEVRGPLGEPVIARLLLRYGGREAVVESAQACGLHRLAEPAPLDASTAGVGDLVLAARRTGAGRLIIGLGGSASTDAGTGMAEALGYEFRDSDGRALPPGGGALHSLAEIRPPEGAAAAAVTALAVTALADVTTPLSGQGGAAATFGPQKGADDRDVALLDLGLRTVADRVAEDLPDRQVDPGAPGAGAAGGLGYGCAAFLGASLVAGSAWVLRETGFDDALAAADMVLTGEGAFDRTSAAGKIVGEVLRRAVEAAVPSVLVCGLIEAPHAAAVALDRRDAEGAGDVLSAGALEELAALGVRRAGEGSAGS